MSGYLLFSFSGFLTGRQKSTGKKFQMFFFVGRQATEFLDSIYQNQKKMTRFYFWSDVVVDLRVDISSDLLIQHFLNEEKKKRDVLIAVIGKRLTREIPTDRK